MDGKREGAMETGLGFCLGEVGEGGFRLVMGGFFSSLLSLVFGFFVWVVDGWGDGMGRMEDGGKEVDCRLEKGGFRQQEKVRTRQQAQEILQQ